MLMLGLRTKEGIPSAVRFITIFSLKITKLGFLNNVFKS